MSAPSTIFRHGLLQQRTAICRRCLLRLVRPTQQPQHRNLSNTLLLRNSAITSKPFRTTFAKQYFWHNGVLEAAGGSTFYQTTERGEVAPPSSDIRLQSSSSSQSGAIELHVLPHRRRKLAREKTASAAAENHPIAPDASSQLTTASAALPIKSFRRIFATYLSLTKPRLTFLIMLTTTSAYGMFPVPAMLSSAATAAPSLSTLTLLFLTTGTALASASANTFNMLLEPEHDAKMSRTRNRPLVRKLVTPRAALIFGIVTGAFGVAALYYGVNPTVSFLGGLNIFLYAGVYTPFKRIHVINTWVGALVGGIPPLMGWAAAAGQCASHGGTWQELLFGDNSAGGWLLATLLYCWQFPHFNSLSWTIREEYKQAGYRMLAFVNPAMNARVALRYSILMFPVCFGLSAVGVTDWSFSLTSSAINSWMLYRAINFWRWEGQKGSARGLFWASVWHLPIVLVLAMIQKQGFLQKLWNGLTGRSSTDEDDFEYFDDDDDINIVNSEAEKAGKPLMRSEPAALSSKQESSPQISSYRH